MSRSRRTISTIGSLLAVLLFLAACSDSGPTGSSGPPVHGGPGNPAPDGSFTPAITGENAVASLETVRLGGVDQWILIRGHDVGNPVLIFLHGGPGSPGIPYARYAMGGLERHFTVVTWDQRGCGKSYYPGFDASTITMGRMLADTRELIQKMRQRFGKEKVYLMGISWGSILGAYTARDHPELLHAFIGIGQPVNMERAVQIAHQAALDEATARNNQEAIDSLSVMQIDPVDWNELGELSYWLELFGFGDLHDLSLYPVVIDSMRAAPEYTTQNLANDDAWRAMYDRSPLLSDETWLYTLDLFNQLPRLEVPVYFMAGRYDYKTPSSLVAEYENALQAPAKEVYFFERSAHMPLIEQRAAFQTAMIEGVLAAR